MPVRNVVPRSIHSRIARASGTVRTMKMPGRSMPGSGGFTERAPGESTSLSYFSVTTSPVFTFRSCTVFSFGAMETASQLVRASTRNCSRNRCSLATSRLDSFGMMPDTWYGRPQFAYETYGPRSTMTISAFSSRRRRRAAQDAPPATPPTMMTFMTCLLARRSASSGPDFARDKARAVPLSWIQGADSGRVE